MRRYAWASVLLLAGGGFLIQSGCAEQKPKGGITSVSPPIAPKAGAATDDKSSSKPDEKEKEAKPDDVSKTEPVEPTETKPKAPADAGSTTGGGTETPGDGQ